MTSTRTVQGLAALAIVGGAAVALTLRFALAGEAGRISVPRQPSLFYEGVGDVGTGTGGVFGVAHNAGDSPAATSKALAYGAQVVEIDVVSSKGRLRAAHDLPLPSFGAIRLRAPDLEQVWRVASRADAIELDLKQSSPIFLEPLLAFLRTHHGPQMIVASRRLSTLRTLHKEAPSARRFLSVPTRLALERLKVDPLVPGAVEGVTIRQDLLDARTTRWLKSQHLIVLAWVVDDARRARELIGYGVDGIATNNLAILELLGRPAGSSRTALVGKR